MKYHVYVGSYMEPVGGDGIYLLELDTENLEFKMKQSYPKESDNPSFLVVTDNHLYAVSERSNGGSIAAFQREPITGDLIFRNQLETKGSAMCHLYCWPNGKYLSAANYMSGSLLTVAINLDGGIGNLCDFIQHYGIGKDANGRQEGPHVHSTVVSPDGQYLYAADLGLDRVFCYQIEENGMLRLAPEEAQIVVPNGEGPRHFLFGQNGKFMYLVTEMGGKLLVFQKDASNNSYRLMQSVSTIPTDFVGKNLSADIQMSTDEQFLYVSNRGCDCITAFRINQENGRVTLIDYYDCYGQGPRNFCITPDDGYLLIANQQSGNVVLCKRNRDLGIVGEKIGEVSIPNAVFVTAISKKGA